MLRRGHSDPLTLFLIDEDHVIQIRRIIRREFQLDVTPLFPGPHASGDLLLLLFLPLNLLGSFLLPGVCRVLLGSLLGMALRSLRKVWPGLVPFKPLRNGWPGIKKQQKQRKKHEQNKGSYQVRHDRGIKRYGFPYNRIPRSQLQHPAKVTLDLIV